MAAAIGKPTPNYDSSVYLSRYRELYDQAESLNEGPRDAIRVGAPWAANPERDVHVVDTGETCMTLLSRQVQPGGQELVTRKTLEAPIPEFITEHRESYLQDSEGHLRVDNQVVVNGSVAQQVCFRINPGNGVITMFEGVPTEVERFMSGE